MILGATFLSEQIAWQVIAGGILIVASLAVANWNPKGRKLREGQQIVSSD